jgi:hypothetical protein
LLTWAQLGEFGGITGGVGSVFVEPGGDGFEVAGEVVELGEGCYGDEAFGHQPCQLGGDVRCGLGGIFGVFEFAGGGAVFLQNRGDKSGNFAGVSPNCYLILLTLIVRR